MVHGLTGIFACLRNSFFSLTIQIKMCPRVTYFAKELQNRCDQMRPLNGVIYNSLKNTRIFLEELKVKHLLRIVQVKIMCGSEQLV